MGNLWSIVVSVFLAVFLAGCANEPWMAKSDKFHIVEVEVTKIAGNVGTVNLTENVRVKTLREASRYPVEGRAKILKVELQAIHFKNPAMSYALGDKNRLKGRITLMDAETGLSHGDLKVAITDKWLLQGISGLIQAGLDNPIDTEQRLAGKYAKKVLERLYGTAVASKMARRPATLQPAPFYTASYARLKRTRDCRILRNQRRKDSAERGGDLYQEVPADCKSSVFAGERGADSPGRNPMVLPAYDATQSTGGKRHAGSYPGTRKTP